MASSFLECGSESLTNLKEDLRKLSESLHEIYDLMSADLSQLGEAWRDGKYEEYVSGYLPYVKKCEEISQRYADWCTLVLDPAIEKCIAIESSDVGGDGGNIGAPIGGISDSGSQEKPANINKVEALKRGCANVRAQGQQAAGGKLTPVQMMKWKKDGDTGPGAGGRGYEGGMDELIRQRFMNGRGR